VHHYTKSKFFIPNTKAQTQSMELIAVLLVFLVLLSLGIYYYYQFQFSDIKSLTSKLVNEKLEAYLISIPNQPEFQCSSRASSDICLDVSKVLLFKTSELSKSALLPRARIMVKQLYPETTSIKECTLQDFNSPSFPNNCLFFTIKDWPITKNKAIISNPVLLYYPNKNLYSLGSLIIEVET